VNLALAQSHLAENSVLLGDFDLRPADCTQPLPRSIGRPGLSDFLTGPLYVDSRCAGEADEPVPGCPPGHRVKNPLELLNMRQARLLFEELPAELQIG